MIKFLCQNYQHGNVFLELKLYHLFIFQLICTVINISKVTATCFN